MLLHEGAGRRFEEGMHPRRMKLEAEDGVFASRKVNREIAHARPVEYQLIAGQEHHTAGAVGHDADTAIRLQAAEGEDPIVADIGSQGFGDWDWSELHSTRVRAGVLI